MRSRSSTITSHAIQKKMIVLSSANTVQLINTNGSNAKNTMNASRQLCGRLDPNPISSSVATSASANTQRRVVGEFLTCSSASKIANSTGGMLAKLGTNR